ncbi:MAG: 5-formyltetrahydrofolate cyclo-ligase [Clostridia bacterium]|nr:5-formyltetrahydrofolate cyclo-ligase [Clostridia bacterium]
MNTNNVRIVLEKAAPSEAEIFAEKKFLRKRMKGLRAEVVNRDQKARAFTKNAMELLDKIEQSGRAVETAFVYLSFSSELSTDNLVEALFERGVKVYAPVIENGKMYEVEVGEDFSISSLGIREPVGERWNGYPSIIFAPLLAVDEKGNRLGYGGGYYDRYLSECKNSQNVPYYVGCAFEIQRINRVPVWAADTPLDAIVTEKETAIFNERIGVKE